MGVVRICAAGRGSSGTQGGSCTEVQAASKVNGANIPSRAECLRIDEVSGMVMEEKKKRRKEEHGGHSLAGGLTMGQA
ncbi:hypothetical protein [Polaromonas sp.]|uniref:hypothetical protein n=1 Tax=Polaromonas sp. TaxID=1869339 RepID=UPI003BB57817